MITAIGAGAAVIWLIAVRAHFALVAGLYTAVGAKAGVKNLTAVIAFEAELIFAAFRAELGIIFTFGIAVKTNFHQFLTPLTLTLYHINT